MTDKYNARRFEGKVAVITASTQGIGFCTAQRLAHEGAQVVISSRHADHVADAVQRLLDDGVPRQNVAGTVCHVGKTEDRKNLIKFTLERFGRLDILFNNAGINPVVGHIMEMSKDTYEKVFSVNIKAAFMLSRLAAECMKRTGGGAIIFNGTGAAYQSNSGIRTYGLQKSALFSLTQALATELAPFRIRVNTVNPGPTETKMGRVMIDKSHPWFERVQQGAVRHLFKPGQPEQIASAVAYLASDDASFVTGESHVVYAGADCRM